jgi:guanylate kinase
MNKSDIKILILGRSGTGKTTIAQELVNHLGYTQVKSYTTRPPRYEGEDSYIFLTQEEADKIGNRIAPAKIGPYEYFATTEQVKDSDIYIIEPVGMLELLETMPDTPFLVVNVSTASRIRRERAVNRVAPENREREKEVFAKREADEDARFRAFEDLLREIHIPGRNEPCSILEYKYPNVRNITIHNDGYGSILGIVEYLDRMRETTSTEL